MSVQRSNRQFCRVITLARPERRNAVDHALREALLTELRTPPTPDERLIVIEAEGSVFCAGNDLDMIRLAKENDGPLGLAKILRRDIELLGAFGSAMVPIMAVVDGPVIGFGVELVAACDWIIASERTQFAWPEWKFGILPAGRAAERAGRAFYWRGLMENLDARSARENGLVDDLVRDRSDLEARRDSIAQWVGGISASVYEAWRAAVCSRRAPNPGAWERLPGIWAPTGE